MIARAVFAGFVSVWLTLAAAVAAAREAPAALPHPADRPAVRVPEGGAPGVIERSNGRLRTRIPDPSLTGEKADMLQNLRAGASDLLRAHPPPLPTE